MGSTLVNFVDHHNVDQTALNVCHQALESRSLGVATRKTWIVVVVHHHIKSLGESSDFFCCLKSPIHAAIRALTRP